MDDLAKEAARAFNSVVDARVMEKLAMPELKGFDTLRHDGDQFTGLQGGGPGAPERGGQER